MKQCILFFIIMPYPLQVQLARWILMSVLTIRVNIMEHVRIMWTDLPVIVYLVSQVALLHSIYFSLVYMYIRKVMCHSYFCCKTHCVLVIV